MHAKTKRAGFTLLEALLVMVVLGFIYASLITMTKNVKEDAAVQREFYFNSKIERGIKQSFLDILDAYEPYCATTTDNADQWGWRGNNTKNTSPFPVSAKSANGLTVIRYSLDNTGISATELTRLQTKIESNFSGICSLSNKNKTRGNIELQCARLDRIEYANTPSNTVAHTPGTVLDPTNPPVVKVFYSFKSPTGPYKNIDEVRFSMDEIYAYRRNYSLSKLNTIRREMRAFYNTKLMKEVQNSPTNGLNSVDDEFVPYMWMMFGDNTSSVLNTICVSSGGRCSNLDTNNIWRSGILGKALYIRRIVSNLLAGDTKMTVDGFNNEIYVYPILSQCANNDIDTCNVTPPPIPQDNYINLSGVPASPDGVGGAAGGAPVPPFLSAIYIFGHSKKDATEPEYARMYVAY